MDNHRSQDFVIILCRRVGDCRSRIPRMPFSSKRAQSAGIHGAGLPSVADCAGYQTWTMNSRLWSLLARKAASIRKPESVGSWLHGIAHRLAFKAREQGFRRQVHERRRAADMRDTRPKSEAAWHEVQAALDVALQELPERYRAVLVLCYLEGKSHAEAAHQLGCPLATVRTRIQRGRKLLRDRLTSHGFTLSTAGLASLLLANAATAAAPVVLVKTTSKAALAFATGQAAAALCSAPVASLVKTVGIDTPSAAASNGVEYRPVQPRLRPPGAEQRSGNQQAAQALQRRNRTGCSFRAA
jgi:RNA polymerase sigma factor (sigma-70 family)